MKKKILASILAAVTMATCAFSAVACNQDVPQEDEVSSSVKEEVKDSGNLAVEDVTTTPGMRLNVKRLSAPYTGGDPDAGIATVAEDAYQLTATVLPADAADKTVKYSVAWSNANSTWAKGKTVTDYVSVTQASTGSLIATAACKQAFGEPIVVTVTSNNNSSAKATATLHYKQKVAYFQICDSYGDMWEDPTDYTEYSTALSDNLSTAIYVDFSYDYADATVFGSVAGTTTYTREEDLRDVNFTMAPTNEFAAVLSSLGIPTTLNVEDNALSWDELPTKAWFERYGTTPAKKNQIINALVAFEGVAYTAVVEVPGLYTSETFNISLDTSIIATQKQVESVALQNTEVEF